MSEQPAVLERYRAEIEAELRSVLAGRQSPLYDMMRYHFGWTDEKGNPRTGPAGKALRPTLCLLACEAVGGEYRRALPAAAAIELVHNYSLIHDDIQDDDLERRHRPTVWSIWGKPQAINAGTAMRFLANAALSRLEDHGVPLEKRWRIQRLLDEATLRLIEGQYLDISYESRFNVTVSDYLKMVEGKTAALIACAVEVGALLGTDDNGLIAGLRRLGRSLGLAFQVKDDILGIWGQKQDTGKPVTSDIRRRKKTLPVIHAMQKARDGQKEELVNIYQNGTLDDDCVARVLGILEATGAQAIGQEMTDRFCREAIEAVDRLALLPQGKRDLTALASFVLERRY
ncbi:MAG: polyprenyl synthetase family protein [Chloroflexi bacterium]|nr:polyprenyl synthetase family protein [Chloroflexota bacterium]